MKFRGTGTDAEKIEPQMAPMIDVVFQLLIFFMLTLKIIRPEGEFGINMPLTGNPTEPTEEPLLPEMKVRVRAGAGGELAGVELNGRGLGADEDAFLDLTASIRRIAGDPEDSAARDELSVEIDPDYGLDYRYFIRAIGAVSGDRLPDGTFVPLVENINFAPARPPE